VAEKTRGRKDEAPAGGFVPKVALSYEEAAWSLGISRLKLYRLVSEGRLPCVTIDGNTVLGPSDLKRFVEQNIKLKGSDEERPRDA
jgi:excisionase family DNA binding protein